MLQCLMRCISQPGGLIKIVNLAPVRLLKPVDETWKIVVHVSGIAPIPEDPDWQQQQDRQCRPAEGASLKRGRCKICDMNDGSRQELSNSEDPFRIDEARGGKVIAVREVIGQHRYCQCETTRINVSPGASPILADLEG
jgi:hypothetical protein